ncbi:MAG TPA: Mrp/NBP35 family ATP-binding protein [Chloroflexota bacterium]
MAQTVTEQQVLDALRTVIDPDLHRDIVSLGFVKDLRIDGGKVAFVLQLTTPACPVKDQMKEWCRQALLKVPGVTDVEVDLRASVMAARLGGMERLLPGVRNVVAVASGKGGVGKSTVAVNVALALQQTGARVGLLDGDIYGPNVPIMMGIKGRPSIEQVNGKPRPVERYGLKLLSIGFFINSDDSPVIWRGPMIHGAFQQFMKDFDWGDLDYLIVDLPPGTGDAPLSLSQLVPLSGVVIVTTPQDVALQDVYKGVAMFKKLDVPIVGVVENMSYFVCPHCGETTEIFGKGGGQRVSERMGIPFLGRVPLDPRVREGGDAGLPIVVADPRSPVAEAFRQVAGAVAAQVSVLAFTPELKVIQ